MTRALKNKQPLLTTECCNGLASLSAACRLRPCGCWQCLRSLSTACRLRTCGSWHCLASLSTACRLRLCGCWQCLASLWTACRLRSCVSLQCLANLSTRRLPAVDSLWAALYRWKYNSLQFVDSSTRRRWLPNPSTVSRLAVVDPRAPI